MTEALELGRQLVVGVLDQDYLCAAFVDRHGLLGLYTNTPYFPPDCSLLNSREYGEDLEQFKVCFMQLYQHFQATRGELKVRLFPVMLDVSGMLSYRLTCGEMPQLVWQVQSLQSVLLLSYAAMVTGEKCP